MKYEVPGIGLWVYSKPRSRKLASKSSAISMESKCFFHTCKGVLAKDEVWQKKGVVGVIEEVIEEAGQHILRHPCIENTLYVQVRAGKKESLAKKRSRCCVSIQRQGKDLQGRSKFKDTEHRQIDRVKATEASKASRARAREKRG
jgi:hypothetical protein